MKEFAIALLLLCVMLVIISHNYSYINGVSKHIIELVSDERWESSPEEAISELERFWDDNQIFVGFSVGYRDIDNLSELIVELRSYYTSGYDAEVARVRGRICDAARDIARLERFSLDNLI